MKKSIIIIKFLIIFLMAGFLMGVGEITVASPNKEKPVNAIESKTWTPQEFRLSEGLIAFYDRAPDYSQEDGKDIRRRINKDVRIGFKDSTGSIKIPATFLLSPSPEGGVGTGGGRYLFKNGFSVVLTTAGYGFIDTSGTLIGRHDYWYLSRGVDVHEWYYTLREPMFMGLIQRVTKGIVTSPTSIPIEHSIRYKFDQPALNWMNSGLLASQNYLSKTKQAYSDLSDGAKINIIWNSGLGLIFFGALIGLINILNRKNTETGEYKFIRGMVIDVTNVQSLWIRTMNGQEELIKITDAERDVPEFRLGHHALAVLENFSGSFVVRYLKNENTGAAWSRFQKSEISSLPLLMLIVTLKHFQLVIFLFIPIINWIFGLTAALPRYIEIAASFNIPPRRILGILLSEFLRMVVFVSIFLAFLYIFGDARRLLSDWFAVAAFLIFATPGVAWIYIAGVARALKEEQIISNVKYFSVIGVLNNNRPAG